MTARSDHGFGNPDAKQLISRPEAASTGRVIAPAPPGQVPYAWGKCTHIYPTGRQCPNQPIPGHDVCLGHTPKVSRDKE